ncbi:ABC transporter ATP-binding protein [Brachyspira pilosicoli]|uniref:Ferrichrome transport ATP-binding protein, FhuC n=1 Tax=Brachyspira pilosicoli (strain ATCC BAA-1826 / 95/1000) TaxID=759914 RepID=D8IA87_BRAP9|nr:ABC transporter ATP-binding protein [Brachyspira pilosicoli]ADK32217.1 ferrichrome transport ATP-binding protein, FhuC [Brachyspira pilosicoli 95/1000]
MKKIIEVKNLYISYNNINILKDISFEVFSNDILCIIGENGSGKSSLLNALCNLVNFKGDILINNQKNYNELYKKIAMMSQVYNIYFGYTVYDTVMMGRYINFKDRLLSLPSKEDKDFVLHCLEKLKILHLKDKLITEISGGELQRVFLARIFAKEPDIIILDEPTNHLDLNIQLDLINDLKQWVLENENRCIVAVLHDLNSALYFANKILILKDSSLYYYGLVRDFDINLIDKLYDADISKYMHDFLNIWN